MQLCSLPTNYNQWRNQKMRGVTLKKFDNNKNVEFLKFETFQDVSDFIQNELKSLKKFGFSCSSKKKWLSTITYYKLKDKNITYEINNKMSFLKKNMITIGEIQLNKYSKYFVVINLYDGKALNVFVRFCYRTLKAKERRNMRMVYKLINAKSFLKNI